LNFCIRVDCADASDSEVVGEGVGGRSESNDIKGSTFKRVDCEMLPLINLLICGLMPLRLGVGRMTGYDILARSGCIGSARCSIEEGGLDRGRGGTNVFNVSSTLEAQSAFV
jgi:hypothetical protein